LFFHKKVVVALEPSKILRAKLEIAHIPIEKKTAKQRLKIPKQWRTTAPPLPPQIPKMKASRRKKRGSDRN